MFAEAALVCEQFGRLPHEYVAWLMEDDIPPEVTRLDWHALNVAAAALLATAHKDAHDKAMADAKRNQPARDPRGRSTSGSRATTTTTQRVASAASAMSALDNPFATHTSITLPDTGLMGGSLFG